MSDKRAKGCLVATLVWCVILAILGVAYRFLVHPRITDRIREATSSSSLYQHHLVVAADSFSGYCLLRSDRLRDLLKEQQIRLTIHDDHADYPARLEALRSGATQFATFTIDSLLTAGARAGEFPATIILLLDESRGADAIIARDSALKSLQDLNHPSAQIVLTPNSPSEFLARVVLAHFQLPQLPDQWQQAAAGPEAVLSEFQNSSPQERKAFALWEPQLSRALQEPGAHVLLDSAQLRGFIVDVLVARRQFLLEQPALARTFLEAYVRAAYHYSQEPNGMLELVRTDARQFGSGPIDEPQARRLVQGIHWMNLLENYAHFGLTPSPTPGSVATLEDMIANVLDVLLKTKAIPSDPLPGQHHTLFYNRILTELHTDGFHPGRTLSVVPGLGTDTAETNLPAPSAKPLTLDQWDTLRPVGELRTLPIEFRRASAELSLDGERSLQSLAHRLQSFPHLYVRVIGQARAEGDPEANQRLAQNRADTTAQYLAQQGVQAERIRAETSLPSNRGAEAQTVVIFVGQLPY